MLQAVLDQAQTMSLRNALISLPQVVDEQEQEELRLLICEFVDSAKARGWPVERVIVAVKDLAADAGLRSSTDILRVNTSLRVRDALLLSVVRWCVEHYYGYRRSES